ncbi:MAG: hypothetical protein H6718_22710 [Polyangiaceae bacterium]|nr:hypothetical protein [Myxococcales bacterium]MCB9588238.1 hypothetical protein [Polyangiaceae bacterium]MCB9610580.1 hypothetical protein [Polyangiaceae bacterium]
MRKLAGLGSCFILLALLACKDKKEPPPATTPAAAPVPGTTGAAAVRGTYTISSASNPGGEGGYEGSVAITQSGDVYKLTWSISDGSQYKGVGLMEGDVLGVGWGMAAEFGVAVYKVEGGKLTGRWTSAVETGAGTETLEGPAGLNGSYKITAGTNASDGKPYTGEVTIKPSGAVYNVTWKHPDKTFSGVGMLQGSTFVVGWGEAGKGAGAVLYRVSGNTLDGKWAQPAGTALGTEVLAKK